MEKVLLDDKNYLQFYELIQMRTGIRIGDNRREVLARTIKESCKSLGCADLDHFFLHLQDAPTDSEVWNNLIKKVTVGETYFFRDPETIEALRHHILPYLIAHHQIDRTLRLWIAGCATGEEPYTLAILLRQILSNIDQWKILILATDINRHALRHAIAGRYRAWSFRETDSVTQSTYFTKDGDIFTLDPAVREMVTFTYHNLAEDNYPSPTNQTSNLDLILCRNVTIYLPTSLIYDIANRFYQCLLKDGWLMVGPSETHFEIYYKFQTSNLHGAIAYQKVPISQSLFVGKSSAQQLTINRVSTPVVETSNSEASRPKYEVALSAPQLEVQNGLRVAPSTPQPEDQSRLRLGPKRIFPTSPSKEGPHDPEGGNLSQMGEAFMKQHRYDEARQCFLTYMAKESNSATVYYRMARLEANAGRLSEAQKWAEQALDHDPFRSEVHYTLALIRQEQGELQEAIHRFKKVIYLDSNFILAHFGLFHLYERTGNPIEAERHRTLTVHLASKLSPDAVLPGSDDLTAGQLLTMTRTHHTQPIGILGDKSCRSESNRKSKRP